MNDLIKYERLDEKRLHLDQKSVIDDVNTLNEIYRLCYTNGDLRATWIGPGIPEVNISLTLSSLPITYWSTWAMEHWAMYSGFMLEIPDTEPTYDLLDAGCGAGFNTVNLAHVYPNAKIDAVDLDPESITFANANNNHGNINYITQDIIQYSTDKKYDYVFALEILEHLKADEHYALIDKCLDMLKPDGKLFITTPNDPDAEDRLTEHGHIGMLNRERTLSFIERYSDKIITTGFFNNQELKSCDHDKFIIPAPLEVFDTDDGKNKSHFKITMKK